MVLGAAERGARSRARAGGLTGWRQNAARLHAPLDPSRAPNAGEGVSLFMNQPMPGHEPIQEPPDPQAPPEIPPQEPPPGDAQPPVEVPPRTPAQDPRVPTPSREPPRA
jgi:hypothetical protein